MLQVLKKLKLYKNLFVLFVTLNIFCLSLGIVFSVSYWTQKKQLHHETKRISAEFHLLQKIDQHIYLIEKEKVLNSQVAEFKLWKHWEKYTTNYKSTNEFTQTLKPMFENIERAQTPQKWTLLKDFSNTYKDHSFSKLQKIQDQSLSHLKEWMTIGALTLIFGVLFPLSVLGLISKLIYKAQKELYKKTSQWLEDIYHQKLKNDEAFKSPEFWIQAALISFEHWAKYGNHPLLQYSSDMSKILKEELNKVKHKKDQKQQYKDAS